MSCSLFPLSLLHSTIQESGIQIDDAALDAWNNDQLENAEALLTTAILHWQHSNPRYDFLAARALVRARLQHWDEALVDAQMVLLTLLSHSLTLTLVPRPSMLNRPLLPTLRKVWLMSARTKRTWPI